MTVLQDFRLRTPSPIGFRILLLKAASNIVHVCLSLGQRHGLLQASIDSYGSIFARQFLGGEEIGIQSSNSDSFQFFTIATENGLSSLVRSALAKRFLPARSFE